MARRSTLYLQTMIVVAVLVACAAALLAVSQEAQATFPGPNGKIAFARVQDINDWSNGAPDIYTMRPDGTEVRQFTDDPAEDAGPDWSPDGRMLAFHTQRDGGDSDIFVKGFPNGAETNITASDPEWQRDPAWSPDGSTIAYDGSGDFYGIYPAWSPDGSKISSWRGDPDGDGIYVMNADGSDRKLLASVGSTYRGGSSDWSPDGSTIVSDRLGDIWVMDADGSSQKNLTNTSAVELRPAFSPDGRKIVYARQTITPSQTGTAKLDWNVWKMNPDGTNRRNLTNTPLLDEYDPDWGPKPTP